MVITNVIARFNLKDHEILFEKDKSLTVFEKGGAQVQAFPLEKHHWWMTAEKNPEDGEIQVLIGEGELAQPNFLIEYMPIAEYPAFRLAESPTGIGIGDWRDLRLMHEFDLLQLTIAMKFDGVYLQIFCPGNKNDGPISGYSESPLQ